MKTATVDDMLTPAFTADELRKAAEPLHSMYTEEFYRIIKSKRQSQEPRYDWFMDGVEAVKKLKELRGAIDRIRRSVSTDASSTEPSALARIIAITILAGQAPHDADCACILCSLPRGPGWSTVELEDRVKWQGKEIGQSVEAMRAWLFEAKTERDRR